VMEQMDRDLNLVIVGHVDHGKSTVIGRLLVDTNSLPLGRLEQVKETCRRNSKQFEYAFLLDALKDEQAQGITIDTARCFFKTDKRRCMILDAPGHVEFLKNMITGAAKAQAALLVIDANEGIMENSKRHAYMLSLLGIRQVAVLVNKMDLIGYSEARYDAIAAEFRLFLEQIKMPAGHFVPVSALGGDNIARKTGAMPWYGGGTVLELLDAFRSDPPPAEKPFRMYIQDIYKFTDGDDDRRIVAGAVETGTLRAGDRVIFYPSGKTGRVKTLESYNRAEPAAFSAGDAAGFTLDEQIYLKRGGLVAVDGQPQPLVTDKFTGNIFWLGKTPLTKDKPYILRIGTNETPVTVTEILNVMNSSDLSALAKDEVGFNEAAECAFSAERPVAFDTYAGLENLRRFVLVDNYDISGGGLLTESLASAANDDDLQKRVFTREYKWERSSISFERRAEMYNQKAALVLITGPKSEDKKAIAKLLERRLFEKGKYVYYIGMSSILYGLDADISSRKDMDREENTRRFAEVANIMLDAGLILIMSASDLSGRDIRNIRRVVSGEDVYVACISSAGRGEGRGLPEADLLLDGGRADSAVSEIEALLKRRGVIFGL